MYTPSGIEIGHEKENDPITLDGIKSARVRKSMTENTVEAEEVKNILELNE